MFCIKCGAQIAPGSKYCTACGAAQGPAYDIGGPAVQTEHAQGREASSSDAASAAQHLESARAFAGRGLLPNALQECDQALQLAPQIREAHNLRGQVLERLDRPLEAKAAYQRALELSTGYSETRGNLNQLVVKGPSEPSVQGRGATYPFLGPKQSSRSAPTIRGATVGIVGGALIVLGWLTPWFRIGGLLGALGSLLGLGGAGLLGKGSGVGLGSGAQLSLALLAGGFAAFGLEAFGAGLLALLLAAVLISIPILGGSIARKGIWFLEIRGSRTDEIPALILTACQSLRKRSGFVFGIMLSSYILLALVGGVFVLGLGFYTTAVGAIWTYIGSLLLRSRVDRQ